MFGHHGLSYKASHGRMFHHNALNSIISHSLAAARVPSCLEPMRLHHADGNRPDCITMTPWLEGRFLVWDVTCIDPIGGDMLRRLVQLLPMLRKKRGEVCAPQPRLFFPTRCPGNIGLDWSRFHGLLKGHWPPCEDGHRRASVLCFPDTKTHSSHPSRECYFTGVLKLIF